VISFGGASRTLGGFTWRLRRHQISTNFATPPVEGYRTETGKVRHRVVANLGRLEDLSPQKLDPLINGMRSG